MRKGQKKLLSIKGRPIQAVLDLTYEELEKKAAASLQELIKAQVAEVERLTGSARVQMNRLELYLQMAGLLLPLVEGAVEKADAKQLKPVPKKRHKKSLSAAVMGQPCATCHCRYDNHTGKQPKRFCDRHPVTCRNFVPESNR